MKFQDCLKGSQKFLKSVKSNNTSTESLEKINAIDASNNETNSLDFEIESGALQIKERKIIKKRKNGGFDQSATFMG